MQEDSVEVNRIAPALPPLPRAIYRALRRLGLDLQAFLTNYPVWARYPDADIYHLTSQNLASLLLFRAPRGLRIVTVHDIIPYMLRDDPQLSSYRTVLDRLFDRIAIAGLKRADYLIVVSEFTKRSVTNLLGVSPDRIMVVHSGIDHTAFRPLTVPAELYLRYGLTVDRRYLIYVGSEDPRKNLGALVRALARLRETYPDVELIKVGRAQFPHERERLVSLATELCVESAIRFLDDVPEADLPLLYNLADVCVMPSLYEGFGFPVLEAMACGTPVVCARAASLPELAGDAALMFHPGAHAVVDLSSSIAQILDCPDVAEVLRERGVKHVRKFRWDHCAQQVISVYQSVLISAQPALVVEDIP